MGAMVLTPVLIQWGNTRFLWRNPARIVEAVCMFLALFLVTQAVFFDLLSGGTPGYSVEYLCMPLFIWAAFRFGSPETETAILLAAAVAIWGTLRGSGPFARENGNESLLLLQSFLGISSAMILVLAAEVSKWRRVEIRLTHLSISDPLTGLANYRQLTNAIEKEITRTHRTGRSFTVLFLDLDNLKGINDQHGHVVGSRALVRVADVLRLSIRGMDTAARFGGDEFVVVLPETTAPKAQQIARRISEQLRTDGQQPPISVSVGIAEYPADGNTVESLFGAADRLLYEEKARAQRD